MTQSRETAEATFAEAFEASLNFKTPEQGELLKGQIVSISGDDAFVSYGGPSEAVMAANELDGLDVVRDIGRQGRGLTPQQRADQTDGPQGDEHTQRNRDGPPQSDPSEEVNKRREDEGQHDGQRDGDEDVLSDVQRRHNDRPYGDGD